MGIYYWLIYIGVIILSLHLFVQYFIGPIAIYFTHYQLANPQFIPIEIEDARRQLPASYYEHIDTLQALGFSPVAHLYSKGQVNSTTLFLTLFMNSTQGDAAMVTQIECQIGTSPRTSVHYTEFYTEFADGCELNTNNSHLPSAYSPILGKEIYRMRKVKDPQTLYRIHRYLLGEKTRAISILPPVGEVVTELCRSMQIDLNKQVEAGYFYLDMVSQKYRPTWKGAILITWKLVWPIGMIRTFIENRRNERLIKQINLN